MVEFVQEKVRTQDLVPGLFVARLDRPWVGTPFPIQGFHIRNYDEIRTLGSLCNYVYIDVVKSRVSLSKPAARHPDTQPIRLSRIRTGEASYPPHGKSMKQEVPGAGSLHDDVAQAIDQVMTQVAAGKPVNIKPTRKVATRMVESIIRNPDAAMWIARIRSQDAQLYSHCVRASIWAITFGRHLELHRDRLGNLALGVMLSEVGYTRLPQGAPAAAETMREHVTLGVEILKQIKDIDDEVLAVVATHHERFNGSGYPLGLRGSKIPLLGQIAGIVDVYDSLTVPQAQTAALSPTAAMMRLHDMIDIEFQKELVEEFIRAIGIYPTGTLVELSTGEIGVITEQNVERRLRPRILVLLDEQKQALVTLREIDLLTLTHDREGRPIDIVTSLPQGVYDIDLARYRKGGLARLLGIGNPLLEY